MGKAHWSGWDVACVHYRRLGVGRAIVLLVCAKGSKCPFECGRADKSLGVGNGLDRLR